LNVSKKIFELSVKNSCEQKSEKQLKKMFKKGYTTKETVGNGKGLYKLEQKVKKYQDDVFNTKITTSCDYHEYYESYYLTITIDITHRTLST
jgi:sensor histidine kinase regulating citrate/malate metabolism